DPESFEETLSCLVFDPIDADRADWIGVDRSSQATGTGPSAPVGLEAVLGAGADRAGLEAWIRSELESGSNSRFGGRTLIGNPTEAVVERIRASPEEFREAGGLEAVADDLASGDPTECTWRVFAYFAYDYPAVALRFLDRLSDFLDTTRAELASFETSVLVAILYDLALYDPEHVSTVSTVVDFLIDVGAAPARLPERRRLALKAIDYIARHSESAPAELASADERLAAVARDGNAELTASSCTILLALRSAGDADRFDDETLRAVSAELDTSTNPVHWILAETAMETLDAGDRESVDRWTDVYTATGQAEPPHDRLSQDPSPDGSQSLLALFRDHYEEPERLGDFVVQNVDRFGEAGRALSCTYCLSSDFDLSAHLSAEDRSSLLRLVGSAMIENDDRPEGRRVHLELFGELAGTEADGTVRYLTGTDGLSLKETLQWGSNPAVATAVTTFFARTATNDELWEEMDAEGLYAHLHRFVSGLNPGSIERGLMLKFLAVRSLRGTVGFAELEKYERLAVESCLVRDTMGDSTNDAIRRTRSLAAWLVGVLGLETGDCELIDVFEETVAETSRAYLSCGAGDPCTEHRQALREHALLDVLNIYYFALKTSPAGFEPSHLGIVRRLTAVEDVEIVKAAIDTLTGDSGRQTKQLLADIRNDFDRPMEIRLHTARALKDLVIVERRENYTTPGDPS
ncbi:MAG: hypothetical protein V5A27_09110, partial [Halapricum sp.]